MKKIPMLVCTIIGILSILGVAHAIPVKLTIESYFPAKLPIVSTIIEIADLDAIANLRGREKDSALVAEAQLEFIKAFWDKQITLDKLKVEKAEIYINKNENRNKLIDKQIEISNNIARFNELRDFMNSSDLDTSLVDHSDPIANQFNLI